jgi:hypothetical protein
MLNPSNNSKVILLLTDGTETVDVKTTSLVKSINASIYSFGIGGADELAIPDDVPEDLREFYNPLNFNFSKLQELSNTTNGNTYEIRNVSSLEFALKEATLDTVNVELNSGFYLIILIALLSILKLFVYGKLGGL